MANRCSGGRGYEAATIGSVAIIDMLVVVWETPLATVEHVP